MTNTPEFVKSAFKELIDNIDELNEAAWQAYILLLRFPITLRSKYQHQLCLLRNSLAKFNNITEEEMQNKAESLIREIGGII